MYSDKLKNQFWLKKGYFNILFCWKILFRSFVNNFLELLICKINVLSTLQIVDFSNISASSGSIHNILWISRLTGNVTIQPS